LRWGAARWRRGWPPSPCEALDVEATARRADHEWRLALDARVGGERETFIVENDGAPLRTLASRERPTRWDGKLWLVDASLR
jgi:hypothetical protein